MKFSRQLRNLGLPPTTTTTAGALNLSHVLICCLSANYANRAFIVKLHVYESVWFSGLAFKNSRLCPHTRQMFFEVTRPPPPPRPPPSPGSGVTIDTVFYPLQYGTDKCKSPCGVGTSFCSAGPKYLWRGRRGFYYGIISTGWLLIKHRLTTSI